MELAFGRERSELSSRENFGGNSLEMTLGFAEACKSVAWCHGATPSGSALCPFSSPVLGLAHMDTPTGPLLFGLLVGFSQHGVLAGAQSWVKRSGPQSLRRCPLQALSPVTDSHCSAQGVLLYVAVFSQAPGKRFPPPYNPSGGNSSRLPHHLSHPRCPAHTFITSSLPNKPKLSRFWSCFLLRL